MAAIIGHMVHMLVDLFSNRPQVELLWLGAALIVAMQAVLQSDGQGSYGKNAYE